MVTSNILLMVSFSSFHRHICGKSEFEQVRSFAVDLVLFFVIYFFVIFNLFVLISKFQRK